MRHPPSATVCLAVETLDERDLARALLEEVVPLVAAVRAAFLRGPHAQRLAHALRGDQLDGYELGFADRGRGCDAQGVFADRADGSPDVDYSVAGDLVVSFAFLDLAC